MSPRSCHICGTAHGLVVDNPTSCECCYGWEAELASSDEVLPLAERQRRFRARVEHFGRMVGLHAIIGEHNIRLLPTDPAKTHGVRDEWRAECSCGWAGPPDAGQGPACDHWLAHMQELAQ